jgi:putative oxidoreductase
MDSITHAPSAIQHWADRHHPLWLDYLRIAFGMFLFFKGIMFISDTVALQQLIGTSRFGWWSLAIAHYVAFAHLVGGLMIAIGYQTRIMVLFQLPILIGAVFFVNPGVGLYSGASEFWISLLSLIFLLVFLVFGSGRFSVHQYMRTHQT